MNTVIALVFAALILLIFWSLKGILLLPVQKNKHTKLTTLVSVSGKDEALENTLDGLLWLRENGTLKSEIVIVLNDCDEGTRHIAQRYAETQKDIRLQDGEAL